MRARRLLRNTAIGVVGFVCAMLMVGCDTGSGPDAALMRSFDALCVATRLDDDIFHHQVGLFEDATEMEADFLRNLSPNNVAGYALTDSEGAPLIAVMSLTKTGDAESRGCSVTSQSVGFEAAAAMVSAHYPIEMSEQFNQGTSRFAVFEGSLVGYPEDMAIAVQGGEGVTTVSIFTLPGM